MQQQPPEQQQQPPAEPVRRRQTRAERIEQLRAKAQRLEAVERDESRKRDARLKIILGGAAIAEARDNDAFRKQLVSVLKSRVTRTIDAEVVGEWLSTI